MTARRPLRQAAQRLELAVNGHQLVGWDLATERATLTAEAPPEEWVAGANELVLRCGTLPPPPPPPPHAPLPPPYLHYGSVKFLPPLLPHAI